MRGLYPIVDLDTSSARGVAPLELAHAVLKSRPALLQLRAKHQAPREVLALLLALKPLCAAAGTLLFVNDRPDLALLAQADGVHVGQDDLPIEEVRRLPGALKVGISTHGLEQLATALAQAPDYVALGPIFPTASKQLAEPSIGLQALFRAAELCAAARVPLVAIGGIQLSVASEISRAGALGAVIADLFASGNSPSALAARASALHSALTGESNAA